MTDPASDPSPSFDVQALRIDRNARGKSRRRRKSRFLTPILLLAAVGGGLWLFQRQILAFVDSVRLPEVEVSSVVLRSPGAAGKAAGVSANGYVIARTRAALSADAPGRIVELNVVEGSELAKGDVVARLYHDEFQAALEQAEADVAAAESAAERAGRQVEEARDALAGLDASLDAAKSRVDEAQAELTFAITDHTRISGLVERGIERQQSLDQALRTLDGARARLATSEAEVARSQANLAQGRATLTVAEASQAETRMRIPSAQAARDLAAATLEKTFVRAPFDGIVTQKEAEVGEVVSPNSQGGSLARGSVVTMVDMESLEVQTDVPETTLSQVRPGAPARIYLDAFPDKAYPGRVDRIWPTADRQKATVEVRVAFLEKDERLRPEMGVRVVFLDEEPEPDAALPSGPIVLVDVDALTERPEGTGVFVVEEDEVRFQALELGSTQGSRRAVTAGLSGGERVVLNPARELATGSRIQVRAN